MRADGARTLVGVQLATLNKSADQECIFLFSRDVFFTVIVIVTFPPSLSLERRLADAIGSVTQ